MATTREIEQQRATNAKGRSERGESARERERAAGGQERQQAAGTESAGPPASSGDATHSQRDRDRESYRREAGNFGAQRTTQIRPSTRNFSATSLRVCRRRPCRSPSRRCSSPSCSRALGRLRLSLASSRTPIVPRCWLESATRFRRPHTTTIIAEISPSPRTPLLLLCDLICRARARLRVVALRSLVEYEPESHLAQSAPCACACACVLLAVCV